MGSEAVGRASQDRTLRCRASFYLTIALVPKSSVKPTRPFLTLSPNRDNL